MNATIEEVSKLPKLSMLIAGLNYEIASHGSHVKNHFSVSLEPKTNN